jgi:hypothetical protein
MSAGLETRKRSIVFANPAVAQRFRLLSIVGRSALGDITSVHDRPKSFKEIG